MHTKTFFAVFALTTAVAAAPVPGQIWGAKPSTTTSDWESAIEGLTGSPFGNGNSNGNDNSAGNNNADNGNGNAAGNGNKNGNGNVFGNDNGILSGNSGLSIGRRNTPSTPSTPSSSSNWIEETISGLTGSPFGNGVGNGNGNSAGNGNKGNGDGNAAGNGNDNGNKNIFGNGNGILSGNTGLGIGRRNTPSTPTSSSTWLQSISDLVGSPFGNGNGNGNGNSAGNGNDKNGNGNAANNGNGNGNGNYFGNGNDILSGNDGISIGKKVRRDLPPGLFYLVPPQLADSGLQDVSQLFTIVIPETGPAVIQGALTGDTNTVQPADGKSKRQVLTGLEDIIAELAGPEAPKNGE